MVSQKVHFFRFVSISKATPGESELNNKDARTLRNKTIYCSDVH